MIIHVTREHIQTAITQAKAGIAPGHCCPIYQALTATGLPLDSVGFGTITIKTAGPCKFLYIDLEPNAAAATRFRSCDWETLEPFSFRIPLSYGEESIAQ